MRGSGSGSGDLEPRCCSGCAVTTTALLGQPITYGALAAAQIGVPVAAVTIGTQSHVLVRGEAAAMMLGALVTIAIAAIAAALAAKAAKRNN